ncbi:MAG: glycine--tRNA ligase subunit beta [Acidobacteriales bacterium]|nr:glycine--tRNA ligase subunit beta [Terriglobales bacterium]
MPDFLLEIGCEEIPARMIDAAREELSRRISGLLVRERLGSSLKVRSFSTPRRLSVLVQDVLGAQPDLEEQIQGPAVKVAFKDGAPTAAAEAFARKAGVGVEKLERVTTPKGEYLTALTLRKGRNAHEVLTEAVPREIAGIYWPKSMYWRGKNAERFIRPVRWLVALLDNDVVATEFAGVRADRKTQGHRVLGKPASIPSARVYDETARSVRVIADPAERERRIREQLDAAVNGSRNARWREDKALLNTAVNLTEWPSVIMGAFDRSYLELPEEILVTVMRDHQKYFAVEDANGTLLPHFIAVLNTEGDPEGLIRHGNERVLRARFNDAQFFWQTGQKIPLRKRVDLLKSVTFQKDLGSYYEKSQRVAKLVEEIAGNLSDVGAKVDVATVAEAAWLAKADLTTELVKEFTKLQGIVGGLYARAQGLSEEVAVAIYDHYQPESMDAPVPRSIEGAVVSLADKADTIAGMFALGLHPSGSKDPFALRRQANGVVKIIAEHKLRLGLRQLFLDAHKRYKGSAAAAKFTGPDKNDAALAAFLRERLDFYLREVRGFAYDVVNAVLAAGADDIVDAMERAQALAEVRSSADFEAISTSFKRMKNILRQGAAAGKQPAKELNKAALKETAERELADQMETRLASTQRHKQAGDYGQALTEVSKLRPAIDAFFDKVMVMVEDDRLRANRLALLQKLLSDFSTIADFSEIVTERT